MTYRTLIARSLRFHVRAHLGVLLGAAIGSAALTGALLVGDSVRESLRDRALERLVNTYFALAPADRFFGQGLELKDPGSIRTANFSPNGRMIVTSPALFLFPSNKVDALVLRGSVSKPTDEARANNVQIFGISERFAEFVGATNTARLSNNSALVNQALARQLGVGIDSEIILRVQRPGALSLDAAVTQRRDQIAALRLTVVGILAPEKGGNLALKPSSAPVINVFVRMDELSEGLRLAGKANLLLVGPVKFASTIWTFANTNVPSGLTTYVSQIRKAWNRYVLHRGYSPPAKLASTSEALQSLSDQLQRNWRLIDAELQVEYPPAVGSIELRTPRVFLDPPVVAAAQKIETNGVCLLTYLASLISAGSNATPYSMVTGAGPPYIPAEMADDEIVVNRWLADDLTIKPGDTVALSYFLPESGAKLQEATNHFRVHSIVPMELPWADRTLMPSFPGIENAGSPRDWDMDFPRMDTIRAKDEEYWKERRGTPKAFVTLRAGQKMWGNRFGNLTAIRFSDPPGVLSAEHWARLKDKLLATLKPADLGLRFEPVREQALKAAEQSQDFGQLFLGFSIFLVIAALLLMSLLFQFGLEQRAPEIGTLLALGFLPRQVRGLLLLEVAALAFIGSFFGALGGLAYAKAMLWALTTIWRSAVGASDLKFHATAPSLFIGLFAGTAVAVFTIWLTLRKQARQPAIELLIGSAQSPSLPGRTLKGVHRTGLARFGIHPSGCSRGLWTGIIAGSAALAMVAWALAQGERSNAEVFFSAGALLLVAGLGLAAAWLRRLGSKAGVERLTLASFGVRGCARRRKRSVAVAALLASGCFVIAAIGVFRLDANRDASRRDSGTGGFALFGDSTAPILQDLNTKGGQEYFGLSPSELANVRVVPFRVHEGDEASCLNLNRAQRPRLLGVKPELLSGRFTFSSAAKGLDRAKGWQLLQASSPSSILHPPSSRSEDVPAIGDANSIEWAMGKKLGDTLDYTDEYGRPFKVRLVGAVANSILQGSLIIDEGEFLKRFPSQSGYRMFLIDAPSNQVAQVSSTLSRALQDMGLGLTPTVDRLNAFNAVQNTYLGTFQILGGLGLLLGSAGLGIIVLRNVLERRGELGLLVAVGFRSRALQTLVLAEHGALLGAGIGIGLIAAAVAVLPALLSPGAPLPYVSLAITLGAVCLNGVLWTWLAARYALRGDLLEALRNE